MPETFTTDPATEATTGLVRAALDAGGSDNITCVVGDVDAEALMPWSRRSYYCVMRGAVSELANLIDPAAHTRAA